MYMQYSPFLLSFTGKRLLPTRYVTWLITTPLMLYLYSLVSSVSTGEVRFQPLLLRKLCVCVHVCFCVCICVHVCVHVCSHMCGSIEKKKKCYRYLE